jgi:amidophosphoribosyltransferase
MKQLVRLIREAQPKEIHLRITSPPIISPCYYGMDFPSKEELIAFRMYKNLEKIRKELNVDSVEYLSLERLHESVPQDGGNKIGYCDACFSGKYPIQIEEIEKLEFD